jgi:hypothetical protein
MPRELTLSIDTGTQIIHRRILAASPLPDGEDRGTAAEDAIRFAAALWGMPDFVFEPAHETSGSGVREVGDGVVITAGVAVMIQSKSRLRASGRGEKESAWLSKNIEKGLRQGAGSIRFLSAKPTRMTNRRRRTVTIDGGQLDWVSLVLIEHDDVPDGYVPPTLPSNAVVMLRRDWEYLFDQLRSARSVASYLKRVAGENITLGTEPVRYHELAIADLNVDSAAAPSWVAAGATTISVPQAPIAPAAAEATTAHFLLRTIQEDIARTTFPLERELDRIHVLSLLDSIPVASRTDLGQKLEEFMEGVANWESDELLTSARVYLPFGASTFDSPIGQFDLSATAAKVNGTATGR